MNKLQFIDTLSKSMSDPSITKTDMDIPMANYLDPGSSTEKEVAVDNSVFLKYMPVVHSYKDGDITNRTERYYHRGSDWIMIKDFPEHTDKYEVIFKGVSEELWSK